MVCKFQKAVDNRSTDFTQTQTCKFKSKHTKVFLEEGIKFPLFYNIRCRAERRIRSRYSYFIVTFVNSRHYNGPVLLWALRVYPSEHRFLEGRLGQNAISLFLMSKPGSQIYIFTFQFPPERLPILFLPSISYSFVKVKGFNDRACSASTMPIDWPHVVKT